MVFLAVFSSQIVNAQEKEKLPFEALLHLKIGVYPSDNSWDYTPPFYDIQTDFYNPGWDWEPTSGVYKKSTSLELTFELARPVWSLQLNFGFKPSEIENDNSHEVYKFNSNYFSFGFLVFPIKREHIIQPFLLVKAGINFQSQHIEDNGKLLAYGLGARTFFAKRFGFEIIAEKKTMKYKMIPLGEGITDHFTVHPFKVSFGLVYKI